MTLLITALAAIISTILWYVNEKARFLKVGILCYEFWGASLMWLVDAVYEYLELGELYFSPAGQDMLNDTFLGLSVVVLGLIIWLIILLL
ncbi:MAG: hypothetical protein ACI4C0_08115, partial [Lachnospiraceae bacterium]